MIDKQSIPKHLQLLDAAALGRIHRQEFLARGVVEGFISGRHRSPYKGFSAEFAEHREYVAGDDVGALDWRVYGRSDRYYIKQYIEETNLRATILVDASGSMGYTGSAAAPRDGHPLSKFEYARYLAACMAHLLINQQDAVGLATFDTKMRRYIPPRSRASHLRTMLETLSDTEPGEETDLAPIFHDIAEKAHRRGVVIVISDLFGDPDAILEAFHHFRFRRHEVVVLHVMAEEELTFPFRRWSDFDDLEVQGRHVQVDPQAVRSAYIAEVQKFIAKIESGCGRLQIDYVQMSTRQPFDMALSNYLAHRRSLAGIANRGAARYRAG
jgi:uncharacterized protein (DUF58 family)